MLTQSTAGPQAGPTDDLELVHYGAGHAWLRRERNAAIHDADQFDRRPDARDDEPRYVLTQRGRDALARDRAMDNLFGPWPTVAEAEAQAHATTAA